MKSYIVRIVGSATPEYVGTYRAESAAHALRLAGRDAYMATLPQPKRTKYIEAVEAE